jgi:hypothetical protein
MLRHGSNDKTSLFHAWIKMMRNIFQTKNLISLTNKQYKCRHFIELFDFTTNEIVGIGDTTVTTARSIFHSLPYAHINDVKNLH